MSERKEKTPEETLVALQEKREKVQRQIVKQRLADNPRFKGMADAYRKTKRYHTEATNLTDEAKYQSQKDALQEKLDALEQKRATAVEATVSLQESLDSHEAAQGTLATEIISLLDDGSFSEDFDEKVEALLDSIDVDTLSQEPSDPFIAYRRAKKED